MPDELLDLAEEKLSENRVAELERHLPNCERCAKMLGRIEQLRSMVRANAARSHSKVEDRSAQSGALSDVRAARRRVLAISTAATAVVGALAMLAVRAC